MKDDLKVFLANVLGIPLFLGGAAALHAVDAASVVRIENVPPQMLEVASVAPEEEEAPLEAPEIPSIPAPVAVPAVVPSPAVVAVEPIVVEEPAPAKKEKKSRRTRAS